MPTVCTLLVPLKGNINNNNNNDDYDDDDDDNNNNNNTAMGSVRARGDTFLTFGLKALTETNTSRLATATYISGWQECASFMLLNSTS
jgi:hypothetical protein